jgi:predicted amino acid dehydrogenase
LDFSKDGTNEWDNLIQAFVTKRKSFEYENEIRAVTCLPTDDNLSTESTIKTANREEDFFFSSSSSKARVINPRDLKESTLVLIFRH